MAKTRKNNLNSFEGMFLGDTKVDEISEEHTNYDKLTKETENHAKGPKPKKKGRPKMNRETKKRITFTLLQSKYEQASKIAYIDGKSVSEVIGEFLEEYIKKNHDKIKEYDNLTNDE